MKVVPVILVWSFMIPLFASSASPPIRPTLAIPKIDRPPKLEDFAEMKPGPEVDGKMVKLEGFTQRLPYDGDPVSQHTEAYLAYDDLNFYAVFLSFDSSRDL